VQPSLQRCPALQPEMPKGLLRATLTLLAGGALAQALPLLLGPWLTRLYSPDDWGHYAVFAALAANFAVVACARFEYALPLAADGAEARDLMALCLRILVAVTIASALLAAALSALGLAAHMLWLPFAVAALGAAQWLTLWANRAQRYGALSASRITQYGGAAVLQGAAGMAHFGPVGLVAGPAVAAAAAAAWLTRPAPLGGWGALWHVPRARWMAMARKHRDFPLLNTPHSFANALSDTLAVALLVAFTGDAAAGFWGLAMRYLKAPATLVGGAVSQALYPRLANVPPGEARGVVRRVMGVLALLALPLVLGLLLAGPSLFAWAFGESWREAGALARALAPYIGVHFVASPLAVVTMAWGAQAWALKLALAGQLMFLAALAAGLHWGGLLGGAWAVSAVTVLYFGWYFWSLATWKEARHAAVA
jgi:O-antigen/teichoic acid export membrane protein